MPQNRVPHPVILGIVGGSATGKTTLSAGIAEILGRGRVTVFFTDDYHKYLREERAKNGISTLRQAQGEARCPRLSYALMLSLSK